MARETTAAAGITDDWSLRVPLLRSARSATEATREGHVVRDGLEDSQRLRAETVSRAAEDTNTDPGDQDNC
jgi:hypothetical protein